MKADKFVLLISTILTIACSGNRKNNEVRAEKKNINDLFEQYWQERLPLFPLEATQQGDNRFNSILVNDQTQQFRDTLKLLYSSYASRLDSFNRDELNTNDRISYDIFKYEMNTQLEGLKTNLWMIPFQQFWGLPLTMGQLASGQSFQPFKTVRDYKNWLGRVKDFSIWVDSAIVNFRKGIRSGVVLPKALVVKMIPQMEAIVVTDPEKSLFYQPVTQFPKEISEKDKNDLREQYRKAIDSLVSPSYHKLAAFLKTEYLKNARNSSGLSAIPQGRKTYDYLVNYWTSTDLPADSIYTIGLKEVERIREEMEKVKNEVNFIGSLKEFFQYMKTEPRFMPFKRPQDIINAFKGIHEKMEPQLTKLFKHRPKTPFEIRQTEAFRAESASAEYVQGSPDGSRPGIFYIPITDAKKFNITSGMESLFLHEAIPGHHYQISLQQENKDLPKFRRFSWYGAYGEGWALYTESLGKELGLYSDPFQYMGALGDEMHRAIRLVVDVAIHTKGMSREKAINYMMDNEAITRENATAEVERYMAIPGQALSYKIGALKIRELRNKYEQSLGKSFDIADFHDQFLQDGCMPLTVLQRKMDNWAAGRN